jgi:hypothetical protein
MTIKDLEKLMEDTRKSIIEKANKQELLFSSGETDISKFEKNLLMRCYNEQYIDDEQSLGNLIDVLSDIRETYIEKQKESTMIGLTLTFELSGGSYEGDSPRANIDVRWYVFEPLTEEYIKTLLEREVKEILRESIFKRAKELGSTKNWSQAVDCKLLGLFKNGKIDFDTLVSISYTDCSI